VGIVLKLLLVTNDETVQVKEDTLLLEYGVSDNLSQKVIGSVVIADTSLEIDANLELDLSGGARQIRFAL
jgi:hypothetical protein